MNSSAIKVVARFRPSNALELAQGGETIVSFDSTESLTIDMKSVFPEQRRSDCVGRRQCRTTSVHV